MPVPDPEIDESELTYTRPPEEALPDTPKKRSKISATVTPKSTPQKSHRLVDLELDLPKFTSTPETDEDGHVKVDSQFMENTASTISGEPSPDSPINITPSDRQRSVITPDSEDEGCLDIRDGEADFETLVTDLNNQFDTIEENDSSLNVDRIISHRYLSGILELKVVFPDGISSWISIDKVKDENPRLVADYVMHADLGKIFDGQELFFALSDDP